MYLLKFNLYSQKQPRTSTHTCHTQQSATAILKTVSHFHQRLKQKAVKREEEKEKEGYLHLIQMKPAELKEKKRKFPESLQKLMKRQSKVKQINIFPLSNILIKKINTQYNKSKKRSAFRMASSKTRLKEMAESLLNQVQGCSMQIGHQTVKPSRRRSYKL